MGQANHNPRSLQGAGRVPGKTEDTVNEARLREMLRLCSGPVELRQYVELHFSAREQDAVYRYLLSLAPWSPAGWEQPKPPMVELTELLDPHTFLPSGQ